MSGSIFRDPLAEEFLAARQKEHEARLARITVEDVGGKLRYLVRIDGKHLLTPSGRKRRFAEAHVARSTALSTIRDLERIEKIERIKP